VDAHWYVSGPAARFPFSPGRKYTPGDTSKTDLGHLRNVLALPAIIIVQASCLGRDNAALPAVQLLWHVADLNPGRISMVLSSS
jgi:2-pyrone-4,6-dicarboxylate lactonase